MLEPLFDEKISKKIEEVKRIFEAAGRFYLQALQKYNDDDPESAYLDLITGGEILSNYYSYTDDELFDEGIRRQFEAINGLERGDAILQNIKSRLFQVLRKFKLTMTRLLTEDFFENHESIEYPDYTLLEPDGIEKRLADAYEIRSSYVHTGLRFGSTVKNEKHEIQLGSFDVEGMTEPEQKFYTALNNAPTFKGLERMMRFVLLRFLETNTPVSFSQDHENKNHETAGE